MPYLHFIKTNEIRFKGGQTKGFDVTFRIQFKAEIFDIIKYLKN